jgi:hypothetical protein
MKTPVATALLALVLLSPSPQALAQSIEIGPGGVRVNPFNDPRVRPGRPFVRPVSPREARAIARREGLVEVDFVSRNGDRYRVEGFDRRGRELRVVIDARTGDVIRVVRL